MQSGLKDVSAGHSKQGIASTSKEAPQKFGEIVIKEKGANKASRSEGSKLPEVKENGIQEDIAEEDIPDKILRQNRVQCEDSDILVKTTSREKEEKTAIVAGKILAYEALQCTHINIGSTRFPLFWRDMPL